MTVSASFVVATVKEVENDAKEKISEIVSFNGTPPSNYSETSIPPDNNFALGSPTSEMTILVENPAMFGHFQIGDIVSFDIPAKR